ncbi:hypothetical protein E2320_006918 [Naja naja]|nr:hypothetical protein E2320_006918 [Naja naja]
MLFPQIVSKISSSSPEAEVIVVSVAGVSYFRSSSPDSSQSSDTFHLWRQQTRSRRHLEMDVSPRPFAQITEKNIIDYILVDAKLWQKGRGGDGLCVRMLRCFKPLPSSVSFHSAVVWRDTISCQNLHTGTSPISLPSMNNRNCPVLVRNSLAASGRFGPSILPQKTVFLSSASCFSPHFYAQQCSADAGYR